MNIYLADKGRPPRAEIIGPDKEASASLVPCVSEYALPHKISEERSISAAISPLFPWPPRPIASITPWLHGQKVILKIKKTTYEASVLTKVFYKKTLRKNQAKTNILNQADIL